MPKTTIQQLAEHGQSAWLDYISRPLIETGKLKTLINDGLRGMTSNPSIFNQAIGSSNDYDERIAGMKKDGKTTFEIYDALSIRDIQDATDAFRQVYEQTRGLDGYVSLEIDPKIAHKTDEQIAEGRRLFKAVARPNLMIKVPSTTGGYPVIEALIADGINVNATLIFSLSQYEKVAGAYLKGLKRLAACGGDVRKVHSVASVFISRIDTAVDKMLQEKIAGEDDAVTRAALKALSGKAAAANSRIIFAAFKETFGGPEFQAMVTASGANPQRVLWASTSTKNPAYSEIKYVTELITAPTVNTLPEKTLLAFMKHGEVKEAFTGDASGAKEVLASLKNFGIDVEEVCEKLLADGVVAFEKAFDDLFASIEKKAEQLVMK